MNIKNIKSEFPIFKQKINGKPLVYLDSANSSQKPKAVINRLSNFYETEFSNVGRSVHSLAVTATNRFEETRDKVQKYLNAKHREEIIFTKSATESINLIASSFGDKFIKEGDEILTTELEHHSNYVPWHFIRQKKGAKIKFAPVNKRGEVEIDEIKKLINSKTLIYLYSTEMTCMKYIAILMFITFSTVSFAELVKIKSNPESAEVYVRNTISDKRVKIGKTFMYSDAVVTNLSELAN